MSAGPPTCLAPTRIAAGLLSALQGTTNIEVVFHEPVTVRFINGHANVDTIRFYADAPTALLAAVHAQLADSPEGA
jgi:hypothetical protein